ncbi:hypothetical protein K491DRAFT_771621 [Lophiostoma macrostomum CBS 122681]|uniref:Pentatricopeptide repeat protein n=1 Tax=Lophiostoma macrostomum CBS 122681 TaxID=1314788 RepID=A0A6A6SRY6_9PLEO|nr:hypothetical protein K491DRAFT_771621 [Lophiostoma macrostomum CBS 122681]
MRSLFVLQRLRYASTLPPVRTLTTYPRKIPSHASVWDPSARVRSAQPNIFDHSDEQSAPTGDLQDSAGNRLWRRHLWRAYSLAKKTDPDLLRCLPPLAWTALWNSPTIKNRPNRTARAHVQELYCDMLAAGIAASEHQQIAYLESIFLSDKKELALKKWELLDSQEGAGRTDITPLSHGPLIRRTPEYLESGIRMYGLAGNPVRAHEIMDNLFGLYPTWNSDIIKVVFRAYARSEETKHHGTAKAIYLMAQGRRDTFTTIEDYDCFFVGFIQAGNLPHSKLVFGDMVRYMNLDSNYSQETIHQVLRRLRMLYGLADDIVKTTSVALQAISILPRAYFPHVFGEWMQLSAAQNAPAAVAQILDMMYTRGCQPETFHFNILLKTLFHSDEKEHTLKAENIGWQMMNEAAQELPTRSPFRSAAEAISHAERAQPVPPEDPSLPRKVPPANANTIALLMQHHSTSSGWEHVQYLAKQMEKLQIQPNEQILNIVMDDECRKGKYNKAWHIYQRLTNPSYDSKGVFPNGATFRCLWKTMRLCFGEPSTSEESTLPTPRELLAEQLRWWNLVRRRADSDRFKRGLAASDLGAIYKLIMHSFSFCKDLPGSLVAMHVLRQKFGVHPSNDAAHIVQTQIAWVDMHGDTKDAQTQYAHSGIPGKVSKQMGKIYSVLMEARFSRMGMGADDYARLSEEEKGDIGLNSLSELIRVVLKRRYPPEDVEAMIDQAKEDIGVPEISTGDMDAFAVA